jgi:hypothetical protein
MKIRKTIQYLTRQHIVSIENVKEFFHSLIYDFDLNFNPDNDFSDYTNNKTEKATFNKAECKRLNESLAECWEVCRNNNVSIYEIGLEILNARTSEDKTEYTIDIFGWGTRVELADALLFIVEDLRNGTKIEDMTFDHYNDRMAVMKLEPREVEKEN